MVWMAVLLMINGCTSSTAARQELPIPVEILIAASEVLNPTERGRPSPVLLRIYELSDQAFFQSADFFTLLELGDMEGAKHAEVIKVQEFMLMPGEIKLLRRRVELNTRFLAVVAAYQDLTDSVWRSIAEVSPPYQAGRLWSASVSPRQHYRVVVGAKQVRIERMETK